MNHCCFLSFPNKNGSKKIVFNLFLKRTNVVAIAHVLALEIVQFSCFICVHIDLAHLISLKSQHQLEEKKQYKNKPENFIVTGKHTHKKNWQNRRKKVGYCVREKKPSSTNSNL